jgi:hypothetical protein
MATHRVQVAASTLATLALASCGSAPTPSPLPAKPIAQAALTCDGSTSPAPQSQFPPGYDYPQATQAWDGSGNGGRVRLHAWCVFAGLNSIAPGTQTPVWQTWGNSTNAFPLQNNPWRGQGGAAVQRAVTRNRANAHVAAAREVGAINNPAPIYGVNPAIANNPRYQACLAPITGTSPQLYQLKDGALFQSNGDILIAGVTYNQAALSAIHLGSLFNAATLDAMLPAQPTSPPVTGATMPPDAIVLKPMLWPVARHTYTALPIWDWDNHRPGSAADGTYAGYEMQQWWTRAVAITDLANPEVPSAVRFLYGVRDADQRPLGPNTYSGTSQIAPPLLQAVGLDRFYHHTYAAAELDAMTACDRAILDASAYWAYDRAFTAGDSLVLVAMHMMTKEQPGWTFQSAWWHPDARACPPSSQAGVRYCGGRPTNLADPTFANYMITTTYGAPQLPGKGNYYAPPGTQGPAWPVAYNPYIELAAAHPITTNCMNCHHRAAWPPRLELAKPDDQRASSYLQDRPTHPNALEVFPAQAAVFDGLVTLDSMWAISDRAGYPLAPR